MALITRTLKTKSTVKQEAQKKKMEGKKKTQKATRLGQKKLCFFLLPAGGNKTD